MFSSVVNSSGLMYSVVQWYIVFGKVLQYSAVLFTVCKFKQCFKVLCSDLKQCFFLFFFFNVLKCCAVFDSVCVFKCLCCTLVCRVVKCFADFVLYKSMPWVDVLCSVE